MKSVSRAMGLFALLFGLTLASPAQAGVPVIDGANLAQAIQQMEAWSTQYAQMVQQLQYAQSTVAQGQEALRSGNGVRYMGSLVNNPLARQYLPAQYQTMLSQGVGQWSTIYQQARQFDVVAADLARNPSLAGGSAASQQFVALAKQAAINRAAAESSYNTASQRFQDIQVLLDKVNAAPDAKDIADLSARIQAEQVMMQNESAKLQSLAMLVQAQKDMAEQSDKERIFTSRHQPVPNGWSH